MSADAMDRIREAASEAMGDIMSRRLELIEVHNGVPVYRPLDPKECESCGEVRGNLKRGLCVLCLYREKVRT